MESFINERDFFKGNNAETIAEEYSTPLYVYNEEIIRKQMDNVAKVITKNLNGISKGFKDEEIQQYLKKMSQEKYSTDLLKTKYVNDSKITDH